MISRKKVFHQKSNKPIIVTPHYAATEAEVAAAAAALEIAQDYR